MVKNTSITAVRISDKTNPFRSDQASAQQSQHLSRNTPDEVIFSLANAYENKRARQVNEWERVQSMRVSRAAGA